MSYHINTTGKILGATVAAAVVTEAVTGRDTGVKKGCLTGLVVWAAWSTLVLYALYRVLAGMWDAVFG